jgi:ferritin-like metal-binding protein YciE
VPGSRARGRHADFIGRCEPVLLRATVRARAMHIAACSGPAKRISFMNVIRYGALTMTARTVDDLFVHSLSDIYSAEKQLTKALPRLARAATNEELSAAFMTHLEETQGQIERIDELVEGAGIRLKRVKCVAMEGLVEEGREQIEEIEKGPVLDVALIAAAQKVEHYEIAAYGSLIALAKQLGQNDAVRLLAETLKEEKATDEKLSLLAEQKVAAEALGK